MRQIHDSAETGRLSRVRVTLREQKKRQRQDISNYKSSNPHIPLSVLLRAWQP